VKPSALKKEHTALHNMKFLNFFLFLCVIFALLDPDSGSTDLIESGSGFKTLDVSVSASMLVGQSLNVKR
jgi:hypothetical protein